jgi:hypothetical protein
MLMDKSRQRILPMAALVAAIFVFASLASATEQSTKRSAGPCRQGALAIIAYLDRKEDNTVDYRHAYDGIVQTCGPVASVPPWAPPPFDREECRAVALAVLDAIEENKINTKGFVRIRNHFAQVCAPK